MSHILIVEDHAAIAYLFERLLKLHGYRVSVAPDGVTALHIATQDWPDGVVTDYRMPGMNGAELVDRLRTRQPDLPAVIVSAYTSEIAPVDENIKVLSKPIAFDTLVDTLKKVLPPTHVA